MANGHHPWCNYFALPAEGCRFCKPLFENYPLKEGQSNIDMVKEYFPEAKLVGYDTNCDHIEDEK